MSNHGTVSNNGHDTQGRFTKGNTGGPGNPFARRIASLRSALIENVSLEDIQAIAEQIVVKARLGDLNAAKVLFMYVVGKPAEAVDPDSLDVQEWCLLQQMPVCAQALSDFLEQIPCNLVCDLLHIVWPIVAQQHLQPLIEGLRGGAKAAPYQKSLDLSDDSAAEHPANGNRSTANGTAPKTKRGNKTAGKRAGARTKNGAGSTLADDVPELARGSLQDPRHSNGQSSKKAPRSNGTNGSRFAEAPLDR